MKSVMIDLETLDTGPSAVVVALGAVEFDPYNHRIGETFYRVANDWSAQQRKGRTISGDTVAWWMDQGDGARTALTRPPAKHSCSTFGILREFSEFLEGYAGDVEIWGNGADFDNVILGDLFKAYGCEKPWTYTNNRCFRTLKNLRHTRDMVMPARAGTHHNALDDAVHQARCLQVLMTGVK